MRTLACLLLLIPSIAHAEAKLCLHDGTCLYVKLMTKDVVIHTSYGKLTIPIEDINSISFGLHYEKDEKEQIKQRIHKLASNDYKERELSTSFLKLKGKFALPLLKGFTKGSDKEQNTRIEQLIEEMKALEHPDHDTVNANKGTFEGRLELESLKIVHTALGQLIVEPRYIESVRLFKGATTFNMEWSPGSWSETGLKIRPGDSLTIKAEGRIDMFITAAGQYIADPNGSQVMGANGSEWKAGTLVGRIGVWGRPFLIGRNYTGRHMEQGALFLTIVDTGWNNSPTEGHYKVTIGVR